VPIPWSGDVASYGFGTGAASWLPQPADWAGLSVDAERGSTGSTLELYREALRIRRDAPSLGEGPLAWLDSADNVLAIRRSAPAGDVISVINLTDAVLHLPHAWGTEVLVASSEDVAVLKTGDDVALAIGPETAVWLGATS
jgi:alpha-glucosidase